MSIDNTETAHYNMVSVLLLTNRAKRDTLKRYTKTMKSVVNIFTKFTAVFGILLLPVLVFAQGQSLPHQFFGSVNYTNGAASNGLAVEARINGSVVGNSVTAGGNYGYNPNLLFALDNDGVYAGKTIEFYVGGVKANETAIFNNGASTPLNLTIPGSSSSGSTSSTSGGTTSSGGGGGGGGAAISTTTTAPATLSAAAQKVDANKDNKIDVLDFNTLMVNWGKTTANNIADFNGDSKVDIFDFNLLMINWTK